MSAAQFQEMVNDESGLLGVSQTSSDMRDLLDRETKDVRAAEAVALFRYQARKWIGAFAAALGGLDTLVFAGGIGENAPPVRERICDGLGFLGVELDRQRNAKSAPLISSDAGPVKVRVIRTDEELMIARSVTGRLNLGPILKLRHSAASSRSHGRFVRCARPAITGPATSKHAVVAWPPVLARNASTIGWQAFVVGAGEFLFGDEFAGPALRRNERKPGCGATDIARDQQQAGSFQNSPRRAGLPEFA